jgi:hypothetical protein
MITGTGPDPQVSARIENWKREFEVSKAPRYKSGFERGLNVCEMLHSQQVYSWPFSICDKVVTDGCAIFCVAPGETRSDPVMS